jgi:hypothetical protein
MAATMTDFALEREEIEADIRAIESDIVRMLAEVTGSA